MWYKLNDIIGIALLVIVLGAATTYGLYKYLSGPPLHKQDIRDVELRRNYVTQQIIKDQHRMMREITEQNNNAFEATSEIIRNASGS